MVEVVVIAALVIWSAIYTFKNVFPQTSSRVFTVLAEYAEKQGFKKTADRLRPAAVTGCGGGCGCGPSTSAKKVNASTAVDAVKTVKWK